MGDLRATRLRDPSGVRQQLVVRDYFIDETDAQGLLGIEMISGQRVAICRFPSAKRREQESRVRDVTYFGLSKNRSL